MKRPKALFIAPAAPGRDGNGLAMRLGVFLEAVARCADTELLILPIAGPGAEECDLARQLGIRASTLAVAGITDTNYHLLSRLSSPADRLAAFKRYGRGSRHSAISLPVVEAVRAMVEGDDFDLVHTGRLYIAEAALGTGVARRTLDLDEDDAWAWRRQAELAREAGRVETAEWAEAEAQAEDRLLGRIASRFDALFVAGDLDRQRLLARHGGLRLEVIPNSVSLPASPRRNEERDTLLFVGNLSYAPNIEGIVWFIREVLPLILKVRAVRLRIVGRGHSVALAGLADGAVEVLGAVENLTAIYEASTLAIAPLFSGAGTRIKVIEAAAFGVPLVATTIATQGLAISAETIWQADDAAGFGAAILAALSDPEERARRARGARLLVAERYDRERIVGDLANRFGDILERT